MRKRLGTTALRHHFSRRPCEGSPRGAIPPSPGAPPPGSRTAPSTGKEHVAPPSKTMQGARSPRTKPKGTSNLPGLVLNRQPRSPLGLAPPRSNLGPPQALHLGSPRKGPPDTLPPRSHGWQSSLFGGSSNTTSREPSPAGPM